MDDANVWWCPSSMYCPSPGMTRPSLRSSHRYTGTFISSPTPAVASFNLRLSRSTLSLIELGTPSRLGPASFASAVRSTTQSLPLLPTATWGAGAAALWPGLPPDWALNPAAVEASAGASSSSSPRVPT